MAGIIALLCVGSAGIFIHLGWYGNALFSCLFAIPYLIQMGVYWAFEDVLKKLEFRSISVPMDFPVEFPPKKKDEEN